MKLIKNINLTNREMICAVGGGGKTTILFELGKELIKNNKKVLLTTTTKLYTPSMHNTFILIKSECDVLINPKILTGRKELTVWGSDIYNQPGDKEKLVGVSCNILESLFEQDIIDYILIEADGAKKKPIKTPSDHEPCIPNSATMVLGVIGIDAVGNILSEQNFHRADIFLSEKPFPPNTIINTDIVTALINWEYGLFKNVPQNVQKVLVLNKVDNSKRRTVAKEIARKVSMQNSGIVPDKIIFSSFLEKEPMVEVY